MAQIPSKTCVACGREMQWRKKWARTWDEVRYCSDACRRRGVSDADRALEQAIRRAIASRSGPVPLAEIAAATDRDDRSAEPLRRAARRLVAAGEVEIISNGRVVDPSTARGALSVRRR